MKRIPVKLLEVKKIKEDEVGRPIYKINIEKPHGVRRLGLIRAKLSELKTTKLDCDYEEGDIIELEDQEDEHKIFYKNKEIGTVKKWRCGSNKS